jgi:EmrB/QacA subfamily drug resistance transporter
VEQGDNRRWWTLGFTLLAVIVTVIDNTVLTVAIPRIMADLDATISSVQWVFTGYALTFASLLVIGGRLGDIYGPRRIVLIGVSLFGVGSLVAALATSLPMLILGEAVIEGIGAALLVPNTLSLVARTFEGRERAFAFAAWATAVGAAAALGPVLGGFLTTYYSWRWAFGINVFVAPAVVIGTLLTTDADAEMGERQRLDFRGAFLIAAGMFLVVFALSQGSVYGWWQPKQAVAVAGLVVWPVSAPISVVPVALVVGVGLLVVFVRTELSLERRQRDPLFEFSQFRHLTFRYTNITTFCIAFSQLGVSLSLALYLQEAEHLSPMENGLWVFPIGIAILVGAPFGGWLSRSWGATATLRLGTALNFVGLVILSLLLSSGVDYWTILPAFLFSGFSSGIVSSQINQVLLHDIDPLRAGAASGVNTTARQSAGALGVAVLGTIFATVSAEHGVHDALLPTMGVAAITLAAAAAVTWRLPRIEHDAKSLEEELVDDYTLVEPIDARFET